MLKFNRIGNNDGDFHSFNSYKLHEELVGAIGEQGDPQKWYLNTNSTEVYIIVIDKDSVDLSLADAVVRNHFKTDWAKYKEPVVDLSAEIDQATTIKDVKEILKKVL